jgi:hypothetical protein
MTKKIQNYLITVENDTDLENPRKLNNMGTMYCFHNSYRIGDKHKYKWGNYEWFIRLIWFYPITE